jgi:hypothetical protein
LSDRIATIISNTGVITLILDGNSYLIDRTHPNYSAIKDALVIQDADSLISLVDIPKAISSYAKGKVEVIDGEVLYDGKTLHNTLTERILALMNEGFPFEGMLKFLENLMENPSYRAVNEFYEFLDHKGLPITEDGHALMYKGIREDWTDKKTGTIDNSIGQSPEMPRNQVDDNREHHCASGFHGGCLEYVRGYCTERVIIIKVNPRDIVSVPSDHDAQKVRFCKYEVLREYTGKIHQELPDAGYQADGNEYTPPPTDFDYRDYDEDEDDWESECDDYEDDCDYCEADCENCPCTDE